MSFYRLFDSVKLSESILLSDGGVAPSGTPGAIVEVLQEGEAYIVELFGQWVKFDSQGQLIPAKAEDSQAFMETIGVETVYPQQIHPIKSSLPDELLAILRDLPPELLVEVQDFAEFLHQKKLSKSRDC